MTADTISPVANQPKEGRRVRTFREDDELWETAAKKANAEGRTMTDVLHEAIGDYVNDEKRGELTMLARVIEQLDNDTTTDADVFREWFHDLRSGKPQKDET